MDTTIKVLRAMSVTGGVLFLLGAVALYEYEKKKLHRRLIRCRAKARYLRMKGMTRRAAYMRVVAEVVGIILDFVYGPRLFSMRALAAGTCLSFSSAIFVMPIFFGFDSPGAINWSVVLKLGFVFMAGPFLIAVFDDKYQPYVSGLLLLVCGALLISMSKMLDPYGLGIVQQSMLIGATIVIMDLLLVGAIRNVSVVAASSQSFWRIIGCVAASVAIAVIAAPLPAYLAFGRSWTRDQSYAVAFMFPAFTNLFETLAALLFIFVAIGMVVHWLTWPLLLRLLYPLVKERFFSNKKVLSAIGIALIAAGNKPLADWIKKLF